MTHEALISIEALIAATTDTGIGRIVARGALTGVHPFACHPTHRWMARMATPALASLQCRVGTQTDG